MDSDIGYIGEKEFEFWCSRERIIATRPEKDENGWDYIVEFPHDLYTNNVLTLHQAPVKCRVQVKSVIKSRNKKQIKLKNLTLLAKSTLPAFILFLEYKDKQTLERAYLLHIDFDWSKKILEKAAPIAVGKIEKQLNKTTMTIKYDETHRFSDLSGRGFANEVLKSIGNNMDVYVQKKKAYLQQIGYEKGQFRFSYNDEVGESKLLDLSLGIIDKIDIEDFEISLKRFGVDYLKDKLEIDQEKIISQSLTIMDLKPQEIIFRYRKDVFSPWRKIKGVRYDSDVNQFLPKHERKFRINFKYVDFLVYYDKGNVDIDLSIEKDERFELTNFCEILRLLVLLDKTPTPIECQIEDKLTKETMKVSICGSASDSNLESKLKWLEDIKKVLYKFQIHREVYLSNTMVNKQRNGILKLIHLPDFDATTCSAELTMDKPIADMAGVWLLGYLAPLADLTLGYVIVIKGLLATIQDLDYKFTGQKVIEVRPLTIDNDVEGVPDKLDNLCTSMRSDYSDKYPFILTNISVEGEEDNLTFRNQS